MLVRKTASKEADFSLSVLIMMRITSPRIAVKNDGVIFLRARLAMLRRNVGKLCAFK